MAASTGQTSARASSERCPRYRTCGCWFSLPLRCRQRLRLPRIDRGSKAALLGSAARIRAIVSPSPRAPRRPGSRPLTGGLYFTALIQPRDDPQQPQRQQTYLRALSTIPNLSIHHGSFLTNAVRLPLEPRPTTGPRTARVLRTEEKGSDVNLATFLLADAFDHDYELAVLISNDSDLALPVQMVRDKFGLDVGVLCPHARMSWELGTVASFQRPIRKRVLPNCQFADALSDKLGTIRKPEAW